MIDLNTFPKEAGVYLFKVNDEIIYIGSSKNLYQRMNIHNTCIKKGSSHGYKQDLYQFLQSNQFKVEFQITDNYRQLEQELIEKYNPKYNANRAFTGITHKGNEAKYHKERYQKYKEEIKQHQKEYDESHKEEIKQYREEHKEEIKQYKNQKCLYNGELLTLNALSKRFWRQGIPHPTQEAKKYLVGGNND